MVLSPQFGRFVPPLPEVNETIAPPREWTSRQGFDKRHVGAGQMPGQGYLFRPRTDDEQWADTIKENRRVNRERAERHGAEEALHRSTMGKDLVEEPPSAGHWPVPASTSQHGEYTLAHYPGHAWGVAAFHGDQPVARMQITHVRSQWSHHQTPMVQMIETASEHRRQGIATAMWHAGQQITGGELVHDAKRTPLGRQFSYKVGGRVIGGGNIADEEQW